MRRMKKVLCMAMAVGMTVSSLAGCGSSTSGAAKAPASGETQAGAQSTATGAPIKVGVSNMVTGPMAAGGLRMKQAVTMAFEEINAKGGVLGGRPLEMVLVDDTGRLPQVR